ncbi:rod shape-determining protein MreC [uncultured Halovibrio sp.]|uniref:rod shape-determining protein MreC n=1 Tax=uncultured Halovibrio sp. TaxID=985049 RepID=UPI0025D00671|nr:rod shape-determining protein MreC [uncultured Halovibrio sp.]
MNTLFTQGPLIGPRLLLVVLLSGVLVGADLYLPYGDRVRSWLMTGLTPVYWLGHAPDRFLEWMGDLTSSRSDLLQENEALASRLLVLERRAQRYTALAAENARLRELLNASEQLDDRVLVADVVGVTPDPLTHEIILNKGESDGLSKGQAVLDAHGLMGQIVHTSAHASRAILISDNSHAVPVEINRNGLRAIMFGTGEHDRMELAHVPDTADVEVGDLLVSSGLGGRFPQGYPVARINSIKHDPGEPFARVEARPMARLNSSSQVLVVFSGGSVSGGDTPSPATGEED